MECIEINDNKNINNNDNDNIINNSKHERVVIQNLLSIQINITSERSEAVKRLLTAKARAVTIVQELYRLTKKRSLHK